MMRRDSSSGVRRPKFIAPRVSSMRLGCLTTPGGLGTLPRFHMKVHCVSLGCPKNRVDTEVMLGDALGAGHELVAEPDWAEVIVVNTCGFIGEAKEESVDAILDMARYKTEGACRKLIVTGCLTQRYPTEIAEEIPEIDQIFGSGDVRKIAAALGPGAVERRIDVAAEPSYLYDAATSRVVSGGAYTAYVKIAEG